VNEEFYISLAGEIFDGYTEFDFNGRALYLKHLTIKDQRNLHLYYEKYKEKALSKGVESEEDILSRIKEDGLWTEDDDLKIDNLGKELENLRKTKESFFLQSQKDYTQKTISEKESEYYTLLYKRKELVGKTAEDYASNMSSTEMIRYFVYNSKDLTNQAFTEKEFDDMDDDDLLKLKKIQLNVSNLMVEKTIQEVVLRPFFGLYLSFCDNARDFFGKPLIYLSVYQLKMVVFGRIFQSIFQHVEDIPDNIKENPEKLLAYADGKRNGGSAKDKFIKDDAAGSTIFGGTKEDVEALNKDNGGTSLSKEIKKAGGKLTMEQMINLAGQ